MMEEQTEKRSLAEELNDQMQIRREKLQQIRDLGVEPFGQKYEWDHHAGDVRGEAEELEKNSSRVKVAGRLMAIRNHGKTAFCNLRDKTGDIQIYFRKDQVGEDAWKLFKLLDIGDIVGVEGTVFTTHTGETTVRAEVFTLLSKALRPLPEKWHGLTDKEQRYRQRYVDLIVNPQVRETFVKRTQVLNTIRSWLVEKDFLEVETPMLQTLYGGANARPFKTHLNALNMPLYLRIAPELYLKRLIVGGFERVFEMNRNFRNEGMDSRHNPEFTSLETYQAYGDLEDVIHQTEQIVAACAEKVCGSLKIIYEGTEIDLTPPWDRMTMAEAVKKYTGEDFDAAHTLTEARAIADRLHVEYGPYDEEGKILAECFDAHVEEKLIQPTIITRYPIEVSPLSKKCEDNPKFTYRFEGYIYGRELANGFSELNDPLDQRARFEMQLEEKKHGDDEAHEMDEDFINALEYGLPPTGGLGIGIDRLVMTLTGASNIRDVLLFPLMKPEQSEMQDKEPGKTGETKQKE